MREKESKMKPMKCPIMIYIDIVTILDDDFLNLS